MDESGGQRDDLFLKPEVPGYEGLSLKDAQEAVNDGQEVLVGLTSSAYFLLGRLRFHCENDNEILLSFSLHFCTQRDERLIASILSSTTTITNMNPGRTKEMMISAHTNFVLVLVFVVVVKS